MRSLKNGGTLQQRATSTLCDRRIGTYHSTDEDQVNEQNNASLKRDGLPERLFWRKRRAAQARSR